MKKIIKKILPFVAIRFFEAIIHNKTKTNSNITLENTFFEIFKNNSWGSNESVSGVGSDLTQTKTIILELPKLMNRFGIKTIVDIPCGDFNWFKNIPLDGVVYKGGDIVDSIVIENNRIFSTSAISFFKIDITKEIPPKADLIFCRDCLVHLSFEEIQNALYNIHQSGSKFILTTSFPKQIINNNIESGKWRPLNLQKKPFYFPKPIYSILENCTERSGKYADKSLLLWNVSDLSKYINK